MSQDYQQAGIFNFSNGFERSHQEQIRRDKLRVQGFDPLVGMEEEEEPSGLPVNYETAGMLSEMFNFPSGGGATELLESQILQSYRQPRPSSSDWFHRQGMAAVVGGDLGVSKTHHHQHHLHQIPSMNTDSAAAMQLFLMNPQPSSNANEIPGGQGLSLSLSSPMEAAKAEESNMLFFGGGPQYHQFKNLGGQMGMYGAVSMLRNSKYAKAAEELLEEFCSVGRGQFKKKVKFRPHDNHNGNPSSGAGGNNHPLSSAADRVEHQRRKVKLLSMLDEVDRRYNHYCEQMQMVVNSFDMVMGFGAAAPYTCLAQKAMSRHFRCLKDAVAGQLKHSCWVLGEKDAGSSGVTKGETPRLRVLEQSLRQQRAFHQMGMMEQEAWRPQRGLPERSVNILRAWLFEHFLHPYPSDADKHLLARQTGLSRNQVSNWFINARVRLWKPMVEDMYQQEAKDEDGSGAHDDDDDNDNDEDNATPRDQIISSAAAPQNPTPHHNSAIATATNMQFLVSDSNMHDSSDHNNEDDIHESGRLIRFGTSNAGDVSLTLGLRHMPEKGHFSVRDFEGC